MTHPARDRSHQPEPRGGFAAPPFIVFSDDWGEHPSSCQHLFKVIAKRHRVLWVNTVGMRTPQLSWSDLRKAARKGLRMMGIGREPRSAPHRANDVIAIQPPMLPFMQVAGVRGWNRASVIRAVGSRARALRFENPIVVTTVPNACDVVEHVGASRIVYYCVDDFATWPGLEHDLVRQMEDQLLTSSDTILATSATLRERLARAGKPVHYLPHGVDFELFCSVPDRPHPAFATIPEPRAGFFGLIDERTDQVLVREVAARMPDWTFVFAGPVLVDTTVMRTASNVHLIGPVAYADLPQFAAGVHALLIPYVVSSLTHTISPLKVNEYLLTGANVIATPLDALLPRKAEITVASTVDEWVDGIRGSAQQDRPARRGFFARALLRDSWAARADEFLTVCGADRSADAASRQRGRACAT